MRVAMGDLTYIQPLGLPSFSSGLPGIPFYSGGLKNRGMGAVCTDPQSGETITCPAGDTPTVIDASTNKPVSATEQAVYDAAYKSGLLSIAYQQGQAASAAQTNQLLCLQRGGTWNGTSCVEPASSISPMIILVVVGTLALLLAMRR